jgi:protein TonB
VGGKVQAAKLLQRVEPVYPPIARQARISGTVRLEAIIAADGRIRELKVISGHPLLVQSALDAVRQWRYQPTLLNNTTVEVLTHIDVNYTLR